MPNILALLDCLAMYLSATTLRQLMEQYEQPRAAQMSQLLLAAQHEITICSPHLNSLSPDRLTAYNQCYAAILAQGFIANPPPRRPTTPKTGAPSTISAQKLSGSSPEIPNRNLSFSQ